MNMRKSTITLLATLASAAFLQGCVPVVALGVGAVGVTSTIDRRSYGTQLEDNEIELKVKSALGSLGDHVSAGVNAYDREVLITGQAFTEDYKARATHLAAAVTGVTKVYNELEVGPSISFGTISSDSLITSKVKSNLVTAKEISTNRVKVTTENGVVYLMGILTEEEAKVAAHKARTTSGVKKVVTLFKIVTEEQAKHLQPPGEIPQDKTPANPQ